MELGSNEWKKTAVSGGISGFAQASALGAMKTWVQEGPGSAVINTLNTPQTNKRESEVDRTKALLNKSLYDTEALVSELEVRLASVIRQEPQQVGGDPSKAECYLAPLASELRDQGYRINRINDRLITLLKLLEL